LDEGLGMLDAQKISIMDRIVRLVPHSLGVTGRGPVYSVS
jgi:hypothetical protein